ncbi:hypothetical protein BKA56DRAFT_576949 [Ilyonectria sp. MPI-CAGE-AT-0026]|nr:hypothetical protein BKA56DRAFT_576949 [Ilyonectria sp. MPI-CAGE-AT-0026]
MLGRSTALYRDRRAPSNSATHLTCEVTEDENPKLKNSSRDAYQSHLSDVAERAIVTQRPQSRFVARWTAKAVRQGLGPVNPWSTWREVGIISSTWLWSQSRFLLGRLGR